MGLFSGLLGRPNPQELQLEQLYAQMLQVMFQQSREDATNQARQMIAKCKQNAAKEGTDQHPPHSGDTILELARHDPAAKARVDRLRSHGVRDEDIRLWWNLSDLERRMALEVDEIHRVAAFIAYRRQGMGPDSAARQCFKIHPRFGEPDTPNWGGPLQAELTPEDRPLPMELKDRVNRFLQEAARGVRAFQERLASATSLNAILREEIRSGRL